MAKAQNAPCDHGEVQHHSHGSVYCPKCRRWGGISQPPEFGVVGVLAEAIFGKGANGAEEGYAAEYKGSLAALGYEITPITGKTR